MKLSHAETQALISARLDGPLDPVAERELNAHLATCDSCRAFNASTVRLARGLQALPYLPASPAVTRAVLDHVRAPRSPLSWLSGSFPANALPAASAIAAAVIVVFVGSFAAFQILDDPDDRSTIPASTTIVNDLAQSGVEPSEPANAAESTTESMEAQIFATEVPEPATDGAEPTEVTGETTATESGEGTDTGDPSVEDAATEIGPQGGTSQQPSVTEEPVSDPTEPPAATEAPVEPTTEAQAESSDRIRNLLGLATAEPTDESAEPTEAPTTEPTVAPTIEPSISPTLEPTVAPTDAPTEEPTLAPTDAPTEAPTAELAIEPTNEADDDQQIVGPAGDAITRPTDEPIAEATEEPTLEPTAEPTQEPTLEPTTEPTEEPTTEPTPEPAVEPTAPPIEWREETPESDPDDDDSDELDEQDETETDGPDQEIGPSGGVVQDDGDDDATPDSGISQQIGDDGPEQVIEPADGNFEDGDDALGGDDDDGNRGGDGENDGDEDLPAEGEGGSLANADVYLNVQDVPSEGQDVRLGIDAEGQLIFSPNPGRVSLEQDGVTLRTNDGPSGQIVEACGNSCADVSSASQTDGGYTDTPLGWLDGQVIYERLNGDDFDVEFRVIDLDDDLQPVSDTLIGGGGLEYETDIRPYLVDGALLTPSAGGWVKVSTGQVQIFENSAYGSDVGEVRLYSSAGQISYVSGGTLILASTSSPGSPIVASSYGGSDYDFSPDRSQIAVVTGSGIEIIDTSGNVVAAYDADGIAIGSLSWLNDGLVFVDLDGGVLRIIEP